MPLPCTGSVRQATIQREEHTIAQTEIIAKRRMANIHWLRFSSQFRIQKNIERAATILNLYGLHKRGTGTNICKA
jgi:hypothetical protein